MPAYPHPGVHNPHVQQHPPQTDIPPSASSKAHDELEAKYNRLKRKYFEMEGRMRDERREKEDTLAQLLAMRADHKLMLDRIYELEAAQRSGHSTPSESGAFPQLLKPPEPSASSVSRLKQVLDAQDGDEAADNPRRTSQHLEPLPKPNKRKDTTKGWEPADLANPATSPIHVPLPAAHSGKRKTSRTSARKQQEQQQHPTDGTVPATVVSSGGTRLKIKPPQPAHDNMHKQEATESMGPPSLPRKAISSGIEVTSPISPVHTNSVATHSIPDVHIEEDNDNLALELTEASPTSTLPRSAKPKRMKAHTVMAKTYSVPMIPRDPQTNKPVLPLNVGIMTVLNLGEICFREHFHTERYIFPVGYEVTRRYLSTVDSNADVTYHCKIVEGVGGPIFQIKAPDLEKPVYAGTASGAWAGIVKAANKIRNRAHSNSVSGPDYFGFGQNTIKHLIQGLDGADNLRDYVWQNYLEGGPMGGRHAAVIPALPDEREDKSMDLDTEEQENEYTAWSTPDVDSPRGELLASPMPIRNGSRTPSDLQTVELTPKMAENRRVRSVSTASPQTRRIPSSMASLLNDPRESDGSPPPTIEPPKVEYGGRGRDVSLPRQQALSAPTASVARDALGRPVLPIELPLASVTSLGVINPRDGYHNRRFIYPVGYELERRWMSAVDPNADVTYLCQIKEGPRGPLFQVVAQDQPDFPICRETPSEAWTSFIQNAKAIRNQRPVTLDKGEEFFGLMQNTVRALIQELPGARELRSYEWWEPTPPRRQSSSDYT